jgi:hypothetical protein
MSRVLISVRRQHGHTLGNKSMGESSTPLQLPVFLEASAKQTTRVRLLAEDIGYLANVFQLLNLQWLASLRLWPRRAPNTTSTQMSLRLLVR